MVEFSENKAKDNAKQSVIINIFSLWLSLFGITTIYNGSEFFEQLLTFPRITLVIVYFTLKLLPLILMIIKKDCIKVINHSIHLFIWLFLFVDCNISVEVTKNLHPYFKSVGYFKYLNIPQEFENIMLSVSLISVYILAAIKIETSLKKSIFLRIFLIIKIASVLIIIINSSTAYIYCFYSFLSGIIEYFIICLILRKLF
jgi:hypothetical protein